MEQFVRHFWQGGVWFEELGFYYVGPIDGHDLQQLLPVLRNVRNAAEGPILVHVVTKKGKGYGPAEASEDKYHGVSKFNVLTGAQAKSEAKARHYTRVFADSLIAEAKKDDEDRRHHGGDADGTGLDHFAKEFPDRTFDVGIAEQHAVTFAAGLACEGMKPFAVIYSTFLQRAYDQVVHDVAIQRLPVQFAMDRAGLVGADGPTHAGSFDLAYLGCLPNFVIMAASRRGRTVPYGGDPSDDRRSSVSLALSARRGNGGRTAGEGLVLPIGKGRILREGTSVAILSLGARLGEALKAADQLASFGLSATVADARFMKPLDRVLVLDLARNHEVLLTVEEGAIGGFGSHVLHCLAEAGVLDRGLKVRSMVLPDVFIDHGQPHQMYELAGLNASAIVQTALAAFGDATEKPYRAASAKPIIHRL